MHVHRFSAEALTNLLVEMGQPRDTSRSWELMKAERELLEAFMPEMEDL